MKRIFYLIAIVNLFLIASCEEPADGPNETASEKGFVTGKVVDTKGKPIPNVSIVVNNTQYYNSNLLGNTDSNGKYKVRLTPGSWYVRGTIDVNYENQNYTFDLDPLEDGAFAGTEGAVKDLVWKLTGSRPTQFGAPGFYGGNVEIYGYDDFFDTDGVELTLEPVTPLADGSTGQRLVKNPEGSVYSDIPVGKYKIKARYVAENKLMEIRVRNKGQEFENEVTSLFEPSYPGAKGSYKIDVEVRIP
jgi:hypothetical protein